MGLGVAGERIVDNKGMGNEGEGTEGRKGGRAGSVRKGWGKKHIAGQDDAIPLASE